MPKNNTPSVIIKIIAFLIISMIIGYFLPVDFLHIKLSTEAFQKYVNNDALSLLYLLTLKLDGEILADYFLIIPICTVLVNPA